MDRPRPTSLPRPTSVDRATNVPQASVQPSKLTVSPVATKARFGRDFARGNDAFVQIKKTMAHYDNILAYRVNGDWMHFLYSTYVYFI